MADLKIHCTTFNTGREPIHIDYFASSLYTSLNPSLPPDLLVLALQEIAPIGYSFLGGSLLASYFSRISEGVSKATSWAFGKDAEYEGVVSRNVGMTGIVVFARRSVRERIRWLEEGGTGVGLWEMGNKGAVGVRVALRSEDGEEGEDVVVTFVAAHLAPMEEAWERRNQDWKRICEGLVFEPVQTGSSKRAVEPSSNDGDEDISERQPLLSNTAKNDSQPHTLFRPPSHIFLAGDLNYRTSNTQPTPSDFPTWPQPLTSSSEPTHYTTLLPFDQLTRELKANKTLHHLAEAPIDFPPTYKYSSRAMKLAEETAKIRDKNGDGQSGPAYEFEESQEQVWLWAKHRIPSWCDRILFLESAKPTVHTYTCLPIQPTSDHRPVVLSCSIPFKPLSESQAVSKPPFEISKDWEARRAMARNLEIVVGLGSYLALTGQGEAVLAGTIVGVVGGYFVLHYLLGY